MIVLLGIGSNMGDRVANVKRGIARLKKFASLLSVSGLYETEAEGFKKEADPFLNMAVRIKTDLGPFDLLLELEKIETQLGRVKASFSKSREFESRNIDLDILLYGDQVFNSPELIIPHPRMLERAFVLVPLNDIAADVIHPVTGKPLEYYLGTLDRSGVKITITPGEMSAISGCNTM